MDPTLQSQIEAIVRSRKSPLVEALALATAHPKAVRSLASGVMSGAPEGGSFLDAALSYLPEEDWLPLVEEAVAFIEGAQGAETGAAESILEAASFQTPATLHPHLTRIFTIRLGANTYYESYPWRESGAQHFGFLREVLENSSTTPGDRQRAWQAMCETRDEEVVRYALKRIEEDPGLVRAGWSRSDWVDACLHQVGLHWERSVLHRLCRETLFHLQFPEGFFQDQSAPWRAKVHPTWHLTGSQPCLFGGEGPGACLLCGGQLHRLLVLDPVPAGLVVTSLKRLELATCLSCQGWERQVLFYVHDQDGSPRHTAYSGPRITPHFPVGPLQEATVHLAATPRRWYWQSWGGSNGRENLHRVGGEPCWIQNAEFPPCPTCQRRMTFLLQLDSNLPMADGSGWLWGSGGLAYVLWCDACGTSALVSQCT